MGNTRELVGELLQVEVTTTTLTIIDSEGKIHNLEFDLGYYGDDFRKYAGMLNLWVRCTLEDDKVTNLIVEPNP